MSFWSRETICPCRGLNHGPSRNSDTQRTAECGWINHIGCFYSSQGPAFVD